MATQEKKKIQHAAYPRQMLEKIVIDAGIGRASQLPHFEEKGLIQIKRDLSLIAGQAPQERKARLSIAGFKVRQGQIVGLRITLRRRKMVDFLERLIRIVLPRVRDFSGIPLTAVDKGGALNIGFREQFVFPEVEAEQSPLSFSFGVSVVPKTRDRDKALLWYREYGVPLKKK